MLVDFSLLPEIAGRNCVLLKAMVLASFALNSNPGLLHPRSTTIQPFLPMHTSSNYATRGGIDTG